MTFGKSRHFVNEFSEELNFTYENESDGILITSLRFKYFTNSITKQIGKENDAILKEVQKEEPDVRLNMIGQFHYDSSLNYFTDNVLKSNLVSIYSFFEHSLIRIAKICESHNTVTKPLIKFKKGSYIYKSHTFLKTQIIPNLDKQNLFEKIEFYNKIRNDIVHHNSELLNFNHLLFSHEALEIKNKTIHLLDKSFVLDFLELITSYLRNLIKELNDKYSLVKYS